jgi:hypothetical protein
VFSGARRGTLLGLVLDDLPRWDEKQIACLLRRLAQAGEWDLLEAIEKECGNRMELIRRQRDYWHVRLLRCFGARAYWFGLLTYKRSRLRMLGPY